MLLPVLISGLSLGAASSLHCIGMCGPISLMLPVHHFSPLKKFFSLSLYQAGRVTTYSIIGLLFGLAGRKIYISGYQQIFSITIGIITFLLAVLLFAGMRNLHFKFLNQFYLFIQGSIARLLKSANNPGSFFLLGAANGFLPCGMVYIASLSALSLSHLSESIGFMAMFGLGTLPAMTLVIFAGQRIKPAWKLSFRKLIPVFIALIGCILILRGLNLNIPFISPELPGSPGSVVKCHPY